MAKNLNFFYSLFGRRIFFIAIDTQPQHMCLSFFLSFCPYKSLCASLLNLILLLLPLIFFYTQQKLEILFFTNFIYTVITTNFYHLVMFVKWVINLSMRFWINGKHNLSQFVTPNFFYLDLILLKFHRRLRKFSLNTCLTYGGKENSLLELLKDWKWGENWRTERRKTMWTRSIFFLLSAFVDGEL